VSGALLDDERGGRFRIHPAGTGYTSKQAYFPDTAVLVARFFTADGLGQVVDFMPPAGNAATDHRQLVRIPQCVRGRISFTLELAPRLGYGRQPHRTEVTGNGAVFTSDGMRLVLHAVREPDGERPAQGHVENQELHGSIAAMVGWVLARMVFRAALFVVGGLAAGVIGAKLSRLLHGDDGNVLLAVVFVVAVAALTGLAVQRYHDRRHLALRVRWRRFGLSGARARALGWSVQRRLEQQPSKAPVQAELVSLRAGMIADGRRGRRGSGCVSASAHRAEKTPRL
jgi:hypothetical protein